MALAVASVMAAPSMATKRATECNGKSELCSRKYSNVTFLGAHNSYALGTMAQVSTNQLVGVNAQLSDGVRALQIQGHKSSRSDDTANPSGVLLCHTSCSLGSTPLELYLSNVSDFMNQNPTEVVTLIIANNDNIDVNDWASAFQKNGLDQIAYKPPSDTVTKDQWPTLQEMIDSKQRLVVFMDYKSDLSRVNYIIPEFKNVWENPYDQTSGTFNCTPDRYDGDTSQMMYLINHYRDNVDSIAGQEIKLPARDKLNVTNSVDSIMRDANSCAKQYNSYPTFVLVDFYNVGNGSVFAATSGMNNVAYEKKGVTPVPTSTSGAFRLDPTVYTAWMSVLTIGVSALLSALLM